MPTRRSGRGCQAHPKSRKGRETHSEVQEESGGPPIGLEEFEGPHEGA